jgi:hypothetical protein
MTKRMSRQIGKKRQIGTQGRKIGAMVLIIFCIVGAFSGIMIWVFQPHSSGTTWYIESPVFSPISSFPSATVSVKGPSIVFHEGKWHVFFTGIAYDDTGIPVRTINYVSAPTLNQLNSSTRFTLEGFSKNTKRTAAPHVFFFEPQGLWYLVAQAEYNGDKYSILLK